MKQSTREWIYVCIIAVLILCVFYNSNKPIPSVDTTSIEHKLDSLQNVRDSIVTVIDTTKVQIHIIHEEFIKNRDSIIVQPIDSDKVFFSRYIDYYNSTTAKDN